MNIVISFSDRENGNCESISKFISSNKDSVIHFRDLDVHDCSGCNYECFDGYCKYHQDDIFSLYEKTLHCDKIFLIVPMYCGNPSSLYLKFIERGQDFFMHNGEQYETFVSKLYIIGIYGDKDKTPDFISSLAKWFDGIPSKNHIWGIERHRYNQKRTDNILDVEEVRNLITCFVQQ